MLHYVISLYYISCIIMIIIIISSSSSIMIPMAPAPSYVDGAKEDIIIMYQYII